MQFVISTEEFFIPSSPAFHAPENKSADFFRTFFHISDFPKIERNSWKDRLQVYFIPCIIELAVLGTEQ